MNKMAGEDGGSGGVIRRNRFSGDPTREFMPNLATDERTFEAGLTADRTHVVMLASQDTIESGVASEILAALDEVEATNHDTLSGNEGVHKVIETVVIDIVGPNGGKMHAIRSRSDEVATHIRYCLCEDVFSTLDATLVLHESLLEMAAAHTETVVSGYTHLQPTQSTTVAHFLLSYERTVARDCAHLIYAYERINQSSLESAVFTGTLFDVNRELAVDLLGFDRTVENSMDASATRDFPAETLSALVVHAVTFSGLAMDLVIFSNRGLVGLSDDYSLTSSITPRKENPDTMELVHAVAGDAVGELTGLLTTLKGLPCVHDHDLQRVHKHAFRTVDDVGEVVAVVAGMMAPAAWSEDELAAVAGDGFSTVTGVVDLLAMAGLPFRTAREVVVKAAARSEGAPDVTTPNAVATDVLGESLFTRVTAEAVETVLDPTESVASHDSTGGPVPTTVEVTPSTVRDELLDDAAAVADAHDSLAAAAEDLDEEVSSYV